MTTHTIHLPQKITLFDICVRFLIVLLPFTTLISVFSRYKLDLGVISFYKEALILILSLELIYRVLKKQISIQWGTIDILLGLYIGTMTIVTLLTTGIVGLIYGGRYDFSFLLLFWIIYHGAPLLKESIGYYLKLFLISVGSMLFLSALIKFPLSEDILLYFGYGGSPSQWQFSSAPPIFHGIDGANVRRFQGILDGPNTMGAFLLIFLSIFAYYFRAFRDWYFLQGCVILGLLFMIVETYSRSALLGAIIGISVVILYNLSFLYKKYKKQTLWILIITCIFSGLILFQYSGRIEAIIGREGSTKGHFERMMTGLERIKIAPWGTGLGSAGPAYRHTQDLSNLPREKIEELDRYYIPESWYIQQGIEGGILSGLLFLIIMGYLLLKLAKKHIIFAGMFISIAVMNFFLHTFESSAFSLLFFLIIGIILTPQLKRNVAK